MSDNRVVVLGVGLIRFGRYPDKSAEDMGREAGLAALEDAGIDFKDVQAGFHARVQSMVAAGTNMFGQLGQHGIPVTNVELACASSSRGALLAADLVRGGLYDVCMVIGVEKMGRGMLGSGGGGGTGVAGGSYPIQMGMFIMPGLYAMMAQRHMHLYGTKKEHFAQVSVKSHRNGVLNPNAQYQKELTLEEIMESRMIADPITLYQCCPTTDGASAVILCSEKYARQHTTKPVYLTAWAGGTPMYVSGEAELSEGPNAVLARKVYEASGLGPQDVDVVQLHDAFSPGEVLGVEELGFCQPGEGGPFVWEGQTEIGGKVPVNTDGGLLSRGHPMGATGGAMIAEITRQLRGEAGPRQVKDPSVGLLHNAGLGGVNVMAFQV
jgi:benzoylsuccinyl-CoA thiolase BbsB subunit